MVCFVEGRIERRVELYLNVSCSSVVIITGVVKDDVAG